MLSLLSEQKFTFRPVVDRISREKHLQPCGSCSILSDTIHPCDEVAVHRPEWLAMSSAVARCKKHREFVEATPVTRWKIPPDFRIVQNERAVDPQISSKIRSMLNENLKSF
jgi:hypothetical protein